MRIFLKSFLGALLALVVFSLVIFFMLTGFLAGLAVSKKTEVRGKAILVVDLGKTYHEQQEKNPLATVGADDQYDAPGLYDLVRLVREAKTDSAVKGIYLSCGDNANGFATSEEIRNALIDFKSSGKFVYAYGDAIPQKAYYVANIADRIYCNPKGGVDWTGFASRLFFVKGALQKLEIQPQIFYAGKFKSATEPLREDHMTDPNKIQTGELLNSLFNRLLQNTAEARGLDSAVLRKCVNEHLIRFANDALTYKLVDGLKYDDEVKDELRRKVSIPLNDPLNLLTVAQYQNAVNYTKYGKDRIALIYAEGDVVGGKSDNRRIGDDTYRSLIRRARMNKNVKAIVIRINSGGGSSLASENIWREITVARQEKPVIVSFGDVAASGAYYLSCNADSVFASPTTITGSIGVFSIIPNMESFFKDKLGITFDGVKTAPDADMLSATKPLTETQKRYFQDAVDSIYHDFKQRVADGRKLDINFVDSIGQGRVWVGEKALQLGLVDRLGGLQDAIDCAARMAGLTSYGLSEYPEAKGLLDQLLSSYRRGIHAQALEEELGPEGYKTWNRVKTLREMVGVSQARIPAEIDIY